MAGLEVTYLQLVALCNYVYLKDKAPERSLRYTDHFRKSSDIKRNIFRIKERTEELELKTVFLMRNLQFSFCFIKPTTEKEKDPQPDLRTTREFPPIMM